ncbi:MAG: ABC transporter substrate-binding protein, partial [Bacteroidaceae bacterium]|nr:ABC transporter substrate-binding protein [Bacteroidaceae bacterium]
MDIPDDAVRTEWETYKIAVIAPLSESDSYTTRIERTVDWFVSNFHHAQTSCVKGVSLDVEWYDECVLNMDSLGASLASRSDICAIVGPFYSDNVDVVANKCRKADKPVIAPLATSEEVIRQYAVTSTGSIKSPFLWSMSETDISQCEALLTKASLRGAKKVSLISPDTSYGRTFYEWIPFISTEMGMSLVANLVYQ